MIIALPEPDRLEERPMQGGADWIRLSTSQSAKDTRALINQWFRVSSMVDDVAFLGRLRSSDHRQLLPALDELYLDVQLRATANGGTEAILEARTILPSPEQDNADELDWKLTEQLCSVKLRNHYVDFEIVAAPRKAHSGILKTAEKYVRGVLNDLPPDFSSFEDSNASYTLQDLGYIIEFSFTPNRGHRHETGSSIMDLRVQGPQEQSDRAKRIRKKVAKKTPSRYVKEAIPFAVALTFRDGLPDLKAVTDAIYGRNRLDVGGLTWRRTADGVFNTGSRHSRHNFEALSSIFIVSRLEKWRIEEAQIIRLDNPYAVNLYPDVLAPDAALKTKIVDRESFRLEWQPVEPDLWKR